FRSASSPGARADIARARGQRRRVALWYSWFLVSVAGGCHGYLAFVGALPGSERTGELLRDLGGAGRVRRVIPGSVARAHCIHVSYAKAPLGGWPELVTVERGGSIEQRAPQPSQTGVGVVARRLGAGAIS